MHEQARESSRRWRGCVRPRPAACAGGASVRSGITGIGAGFGAGSAYADSQREVALLAQVKLLYNCNCMSYHMHVSCICCMLTDSSNIPVQTGQLPAAGSHHKMHYYSEHLISTHKAEAELFVNICKTCLGQQVHNCKSRSSANLMWMQIQDILKLPAHKSQASQQWWSRSWRRLPCKRRIRSQGNCMPLSHACSMTTQL